MSLLFREGDSVATLSAIPHPARRKRGISEIPALTIVTVVSILGDMAVLRLPDGEMFSTKLDNLQQIPK